MAEALVATDIRGVEVERQHQIHRLLADYLEDYCDDDGFMFFNCHDWYLYLDPKKKLPVCFLTFQGIRHSSSLQHPFKLVRVGVSGTLLKWFTSYLSCHQQRVVWVVPAPPQQRMCLVFHKQEKQENCKMKLKVRKKRWLKAGSWSETYED